jgi:transcriptional regulator with XRE-family HTH domain
MISINMETPQEIQQKIMKQARAKRLELNLSHQTLSEKSGVSYGVLKNFERTGQISLESLIKIALTLGCINDFNILFAPKQPETALSLDELIEKNPRKKPRKRGRK